MGLDQNLTSQMDALNPSLLTGEKLQVSYLPGMPTLHEDGEGQFFIFLRALCDIIHITYNPPI